MTYQMNDILRDILTELESAERQHPIWPAFGHRGDHVRAVSKLAEETGEAVLAVNNYDEGKGTIEEIRKELIQTAAMAIRNLKNLDRVERTRIEEIEPKHDDNVHWHYLNMERIRYPQKAERLIEDYADGSGV